MATYYMRADGTATKTNAVGPATDSTKCMSMTTYNAATFASGDIIVLSHLGGVFRGSSLVLKSNLTYTKELSANIRPVISGARDYSTSSYKWNLSTYGTNNYYLTTDVGGNPSASSPTIMWADVRILRAADSLTALNNMEFAYGDNDSLGFNTIYIRDDRGNPTERGVLIEANNTNLCIRLTEYIENVTIDGIEIRQAAAAGLQLNFTTTSAVSANITVKNCKIHHCSNNISIRNATNLNIINCEIDYSQSFGNGILIEGNLASTINMYCCKMYRNKAYGVYYNSKNASSILKIVNCNLINSQNLMINALSGSAGSIELVNTVLTSSPTASQSAPPMGSSSVSVAMTAKNCWLPKNPYNVSVGPSNLTELSDNIYSDQIGFLAPAREGILVLAFDDTTSWESLKAWYTYANNKGVKLSFGLDKTNDSTKLTPTIISEVQTFIDAGNGVFCHTRTHSDMGNRVAINIKYVGSGSACAMTISNSSLTTNCTDASADNLNIDLSLYANVQALVTYIDSLAGYTCALASSKNDEAHVYDAEENYTLLLEQSEVDIKTPVSGYVVAFDDDRFLTYEMYKCKLDLQEKFPTADINTFAFPFGSYDDTALQKVYDYGFHLARMATSFGTTDLENLDTRNLHGIPGETYWTINTEGVKTAINQLIEYIASHGAIVATYWHDTSAYTSQWQTIVDEIKKALDNNYIAAETMESAAQLVRTSGTTVNGYTYRRFYDADTPNYVLMSTSPLSNAGDQTALAGVANLYTMDGIQLTDASGDVVVDSVNIGAYGTLVVGPTITTHPENDSVIEGQPAQFTVEATGTGTLHYQWKKGSSNVGTDSATLSLVTTIEDNGAQITCVVTDDNGSTTTNAATLTVTARVLTSIVVSPASTRVAFNKTKQFTANGFDQLGDPISTGTITWSATGGTITDGLFTAGETAGEFAVTATVGLITKDVVVRVLEKIPSTSYRARIAVKVGF